MIRQFNIHYFMFAAFFSFTFIQCNKHEPCEEKKAAYQFKVGEKYCLGAHEYVEIDSIADSRCPTGIDCIWEGKTDIFIYLFAHNTLHDAILSVPNKGESIVIPDIYGYDFVVDSITPYPAGTELINQAKYRVHMQIKER